MLNYLFVFFILAWLLGFIQIPFLHATLFSIIGYPFTLYHLLLLTIFLFVIKYLRGPIKTVAIILLVMWVLSLLGFMVFSGFSNFLIFLAIIAVLMHILRGY